MRGDEGTPRVWSVRRKGAGRAPRVDAGRGTAGQLPRVWARPRRLKTAAWLSYSIRTPTISCTFRFSIRDAKTMPRLSDFLAAAGGSAAGAPAAAGRQRPPSGPLLPAPTSTAITSKEPEQQPASGDGSKSSEDSAAAAEAVVARLRQLHARRLRSHGPRRYRHPDGSLRLEPPPREPLVVVSQQSSLLHLTFVGWLLFTSCLC
jgi:hypothetical protein